MALTNAQKNIRATYPTDHMDSRPAPWTDPRQSAYEKILSLDEVKHTLNLSKRESPFFYSLFSSRIKNAESPYFVVTDSYEPFFLYDYTRELEIFPGTLHQTSTDPAGNPFAESKTSSTYGELFVLNLKNASGGLTSDAKEKLGKLFSSLDYSDSDTTDMYVFNNTRSTGYEATSNIVRFMLPAIVIGQFDTSDVMKSATTFHNSTATILSINMTDSAQTFDGGITVPANSIVVKLEAYPAGDIDPINLASGIAPMDTYSYEDADNHVHARFDMHEYSDSYTTRPTLRGVTLEDGNTYYANHERAWEILYIGQSQARPEGGTFDLRRHEWGAVDSRKNNVQIFMSESWGQTGTMAASRLDPQQTQYLIDDKTRAIKKMHKQIEAAMLWGNRGEYSVASRTEFAGGVYLGGGVTRVTGGLFDYSTHPIPRAYVGDIKAMNLLKWQALEGALWRDLSDENQTLTAYCSPNLLRIMDIKVANDIMNNELAGISYYSTKDIATTSMKTLNLDIGIRKITWGGQRTLNLIPVPEWKNVGNLVKDGVNLAKTMVVVDMNNVSIKQLRGFTKKTPYKGDLDGEFSVLLWEGGLQVEKPYYHRILNFA